MWNTKRGVQTACIMAALWLASSAQAQWLERTIVLDPGWNAVYLDVQPEPNTPADVFAGLPIESVWFWSPSRSQAQFLQDMNDLLPTEPDWGVYIPAGQPEAELTSLFALFAGSTYLIKVSGAVPVNWVVRGQPRRLPLQWIQDSYNLVGFDIDAAAQPTIEDFFAPAPAHADHPVFRLKTDGLWEEIASPSTEVLEAYHAYWVFSDGPSDYQGPLGVSLDLGEGTEVRFGVSGLMVNLLFENLSSQSRTINLSQIGSSLPPDPAYRANFGPVPLNYMDLTVPLLQREWVPFPNPLQLTAGPGEEIIVELQVDRESMVAPVLPAGFTAGEYQDVLQVTDGAGMKYFLPVTAQGITTSATLAKSMAKGLSTPDLRAGLWVGTVQINAVSQPTGVPALFDPVPVPDGNEFQFRIVLHSDDLGNVRLLRAVTQMIHTPTFVSIPDPADASQSVLAIDDNQPGYQVLITEDGLFDKKRIDDGRLLYEGVNFRGGKAFAERVSSAAFSHTTPASMMGRIPEPCLFSTAMPCSGGEIFSQLSVTLTIPFDDPLNPFVHQFHPDHDNLDPDFDPLAQGRFPADPPGEGVESYTITRTLSFDFSVTDPFDAQVLGWGDTVLGGTFQESIGGIFNEEAPNPTSPPPFIIPPLKVSGSFRIERTSAVGELNDPNAALNDPDGVAP